MHGTFTSDYEWHEDDTKYKWKLEFEAHGSAVTAAWLGSSLATGLLMAST